MAMLLPDPFESLFNLQQSLDAFRQSSWLGSSPSAGGAFPPVNVFRKGEDFVAITEVPGIAKSDLDIEVKDNALRISGTKKIAYEDGSVHRRERVSGRFDRAVTIPVRIDANRVQAEYRDGMLAIYLPRAESDKPRSVKIA